MNEVISKDGARIALDRVGGGERTVTPGPCAGENELRAGYTIARVASLDEAVEWASRFGAIVGDVEIDIRPVTEPWDLGLAPAPADATTSRFDPFAESRELIAGFVLVEVGSLEDAMRWADVYVDAVGCSEVDVRPLAEEL